MAKSSPKRNSLKKKAPSKKVAPKKAKADPPKTTSKKDCDDGVCDITKPKVAQAQPESSSCCLWGKIKKWFS